MTKWKCTTHNILLTVEGDKRIFETPPSSIRGLPPCKLLIMNPVVEGEVGNCQIEKEEGGPPNHPSGPPNDIPPGPPE